VAGDDGDFARPAAWPLLAGNVVVAWRGEWEQYFRFRCGVGRSRLCRWRRASRAGVSLWVKGRFVLGTGWTGIDGWSCGGGGVPATWASVIRKRRFWPLLVRCALVVGASPPGGGCGFLSSCGGFFRIRDSLGIFPICGLGNLRRLFNRFGWVSLPDGSVCRYGSLGI